ncbi:MAG: hypothetical protein ACM3SQ_17615 [Betaproteobacteria bacterium]
MELMLGSHVREHGNRVGRLAGFELEPTSLRIRRIIYSPDGDLGPQTHMRPLCSVSHVHDDGEVELRPESQADVMPSIPDVTLLSRPTRIRQESRELGRLVGLEINPADCSIVSLFGRAHWWSRRFSLSAERIDCSVPGEIRVGSKSTQAA